MNSRPTGMSASPGTWGKRGQVLENSFPLAPSEPWGGVDWVGNLRTPMPRVDPAPQRRERIPRGAEEAACCGSAGLEGGGAQKAGGVGWAEESPNRLKIAREIIPTPPQNRNSPLSLTKGRLAARQRGGVQERRPVRPHPILPPAPWPSFPSWLSSGCA